VLTNLKAGGISFSLAVLGEQYELYPKIFDQVKEDFQAEIAVWGYQKFRKDYLSWLSRGTVVVSTAIQENFGISVMEAVAHGCFPLLPNRLSYPELMPGKFRELVIYKSDRTLETRLAQVLKAPEQIRVARRELAEHAAGFSWEAMILAYDDFMAQTLNRSRNPNKPVG